MKKLHFTYNMRIEYSTPVSNCNFTIKCIPVNTLRQRIDNLKIGLEPCIDYQWGVDGFRNTYIWGKNTEPHLDFTFSIEGDAGTGFSDFEADYNYETDIIFAHPHGLNTAGEAIKAFYVEKVKGLTGSVFDKALAISRLLHDEMHYLKGSTNVNTSAEEAFAQRQGVCQDYAHILIALFHLAGIPARYVTGFIIGEGESHAWVEFLLDGRWQGIDPTNNTRVNDDYIKLGSGRDAGDCMINRGIMHGGGAHSQTVKVRVVEEGN